MKVKPKAFSVALIISFIVAIIIFLIIPIIGMESAKIEYKIFESISELDCLYDLNTEFLESDKDIWNLEYSESITLKVKFNGKTFNIYAYVFADNKGARNYFKYVTGRNKVEREYDFVMSGNYYFKNKIVAYKGNNAYKIDGGNYHYLKGFVDYINEHLTFSF